MVCDLSMVVRHLRVILNTEGVILVSSYSQTQFINSDNPVSSWSFKHMKLYHVILRSLNNSELTETHLEHHIRFEEHLLPDHHKTPCS